MTIVEEVEILVTTNAAAAAAQLDALSGASTGLADKSVVSSVANDANSTSITKTGESAASTVVSTDSLAASTLANAEAAKKANTTYRDANGVLRNADGTFASTGATIDKTTKSTTGLTNATNASHSSLTKGNKLIKDVAYGYIAAGVAMVYLGVKQQDATASIAAHADVSMRAAQQVMDGFNSMAFTGKFTSTEIGNAFAAVAGQVRTLNGQVMNAKSAHELMTQAQIGAEASGQDLATTTGNIVNILQAYGLNTKSAAMATNVLYNVSEQTGNSMDTVATTISAMRTQLGALAPSLQETGALIADLAHHGESGSRGSRGLRTVSTGLNYYENHVIKARKAAQVTKTLVTPLPAYLQGIYNDMQNLSPKDAKLDLNKLSTSQIAQIKLYESQMKKAATEQTKTTASAIPGLTNANGSAKDLKQLFDELYPRLDKMKDKTQRLALMDEYFGNIAGPKLLQTFLAGPAAFDKYTSSVSKAGSAQEAAQKQMGTAAGQFSILFHGFESVFGDFGTNALPFIKDGVTDLSDMFHWLDKNKTAAEAVRIAVAGVGVLITSVFAVRKLDGFLKDANAAVNIMKHPFSNLGNSGSSGGFGGGSTTVSGGTLQTAADNMLVASENMMRAAGLEVEAGNKDIIGGNESMAGAGAFAGAVPALAAAFVAFEIVNTGNNARNRQVIKSNNAAGDAAWNAYAKKNGLTESGIGTKAWTDMKAVWEKSYGGMTTASGRTTTQDLQILGNIFTAGGVPMPNAGGKAITKKETEELKQAFEDQFKYDKANKAKDESELTAALAAYDKSHNLTSAQAAAVAQTIKAEIQINGNQNTKQLAQEIALALQKLSQVNPSAAGKKRH